MKSIGKGSRLLGVTTILLLVGSVFAGWDDGCPREPDGRACLPTLDNCADVNQTSVRVQLGGIGSVGTADSCTSSPARDDDGYIVESDLEFVWDRGDATLSLIAANVTCQPSQSKITAVWFNLPDAFSSCELKSAELHNPDGSVENVCRGASCLAETGGRGWTLSDQANGEGCLGDFDMELHTTNGQHKGVLPGGELHLDLSCAGSNMDAYTACDIATEGSDGEIGERLAQAAMHFQRTGENSNLSNKVSSNCQQELFVDLASFEATPGDSKVTLDWSTALEVDNAGFLVERRNLLTGEIVTINRGLIPAQGDIYQGASYSHVDSTAINGVEYEYSVVDVELGGRRTIHPGTVATANPVRPPIRLIRPERGFSDLRLGQRPTFEWKTDRPGSVSLQLSSDPAFADPATTLELPLNGRGRLWGARTLTPDQTARMEEIALANQGVTYWRIVREEDGGERETSATFSLHYGVIEDNTSPARGSRGIGRERGPRR